ncbi:MAG: alpha/beta fold hydrolase [Elusimicrobiaceae bacterium]|nr:alpha/beta fold hydrolase [Elusimicrobiaceae bacterium]
MKKLLLLCVCLTLLTACATRPVHQDFTLQGDHGKLSAVLQTPKDKKTSPLVIIMHGFNASKDMYLLTDLAVQLNERGIATLLFDFNGHGASEGSFLDMTIPNELEDARRVYAYAEKLPKVQSISLTGHSMGAVVAAMLAGELGQEKIKTIVLMSPAPELTEDTARGDLFGVRYDTKHVPQYITLPNGLKVGRSFLSTTPDVKIYETAKHYTGPVLIVHSVDDQLVPYVYGVQFSEIYTNAHLEKLHGLDHNFTQDTPGVNKKIADYLEAQLTD